jgi:hypothetical protein
VKRRHDPGASAEHELGRLNPEVLAWTEDAEERALLVRLFGE